LLDCYTNLLLKGNSAADIDVHHRLLLKFCTDCFFQRGGGSDQPNQDHKLAIYFMATFEKINLPRYLMHHLCWAMNEAINKDRKQVPCGRLLSEIFHQGKLLEILRRSKATSDKCFKVSTADKIINSRTLCYMGFIDKIPSKERGMEFSTADLEVIMDFPSITKENNPEVLAELIAAHDKESGANNQDKVAPDAPVTAKGKRARIITESEAAAGKAKKQKVAKSKETNSDNAPGLKAKKRRGKGETVITKEQLEKALEEIKEEEHKPKKKKQASLQIVSPMVVVTPALEKRLRSELSI
jgi:hypothetical protein